MRQGDVEVEARMPRERDGVIKTITAVCAGDIIYHRDRITLTSEQSRRKFLRTAVKRGAPEIPDGALIAIELAIYAALREAATDTEEGEPTPYESTPTGIVSRRSTRDGDVLVQLTNFAASIIEDVAADDGVEVLRHFKIEAELNGRTVMFTVSASRFATMAWPMEHLGAEAVVFAGSGTKDHTRAAIQLLSGHVPNRHIYSHLGWRPVPTGSVYLHAGGAIGPDGPVPDIQVELPDSCTRFVLALPSDSAGCITAVRASLAMLKVAPHRITIPVLAATVRAVIGSVDFTVHLAGSTGVYKTELSALAQQHYGAEMDARHLPASWTSTANALEATAFHAKDALLVVDDFVPRSGQSDVQLHRDADRLLRAQGNQAGRQRMGPDATLRPPKPPRGLILSTGEDVPQGHSLRARMLVVEINPGDVNLERLTTCQADAAAGLYAQSTGAFVRWLAAQYDDVSRRLPAERAALRDAVISSVLHPRTAGIIADLAVGLRYFLHFAVDVGAITLCEADHRWNEAWSVLVALGGNQTEHHRAADPVERFTQLLSAALARGEAHVASSDGSAPHDVSGNTLQPATAWGWRVEGTRPTAQGARVGWLNGGDLFLDPKVVFAAVQRRARAQGEAFAITDETLRKRLRERGLLASTDGARDRLVVRQTLEGQRRAVLHLHADVLMLKETAQAAQPSHEGPGGPTGPPFQGHTPPLYERES